MANAFSQLDTSFPSMDGKNTEAKIQAIQDYLYQLLEQLRYTMNNINPDNFNEAEVNGWAGETIVKPIHAEITDVENGLITRIDATAAGITVNVQKEYAAEWTVGTRYYLNDFVKVTTVNSDQTETVNFYKCIDTAAEGHVAADTNKPGSGTAWQTYWVQVAAADVAYSRFDITADAIRTEVSRAKGAELSLTTSITQTADAIRLEASRVYAPLWDQNGTYYKNNIVHTESGDPVVVKYWMCTADSTTQNPLDVSQTDWLEVPEANILNSRFQVTADAITSEVSRATAAEGQISSQITQKADEILLQVKGDYAPEWNIYRHPDAAAWVGGVSYAVGDIAKSSDVVYKCIEAHTSSSANQPPNATYWETDSTYYKNDVVKVTTIVDNKVTAVTLYECLQEHTASNATKPPNATYWEVFTDPTVQSVIDMNLNGITLAYDSVQDKNSSYIKLTKDGIDMGGGKITMSNVEADSLTANAINSITLTADKITSGTLNSSVIYAGDISADQITTGTLNAGDIVLMDSFTAKAKDSGVIYDCGTLGGYVYLLSGQPYPVIYLESNDGTKVVQVGDEDVNIASYDVNTRKNTKLRVGADVTIESEKSDDVSHIGIEPDSIVIKATHNNEYGEVSVQKDDVSIEVSGSEGTTYIDVQPDAIIASRSLPGQSREIVNLFKPCLPLYRFTDMTANTVSALLSSLNANKSQIPTGPSVVACGNSSNSNRCMVMLFKSGSTAGRGVTISPYTACNNINVYLNSSGDWAQASS